MAVAVLVAAAVFVLVQVFEVLAPVLLSFLLILLISMAANPVILRVREWTGGRTIATGLLATALLAGALLTGWAIFGPMKHSVSLLIEKAPSYWERLQKPLIKIERKAKQSEEKLQKEVATEIAEESADSGETRFFRASSRPAVDPPAEPTGFRTALRGMVLGAFAKFAEGAFNAAQFAIILITVFLGVTFTLMNPRPIFRAIFLVIPERRHEQALAIMQRVGKFVPGWAGATLLGMFTIGFLVFLLMWPIFGFMDALVLGFLAFVLEAIPFIGPILAAIPALLLAISAGGMTPLWVVLAYITVQALEGNVILPMIMARGLKLHPVAVIFSMFLSVAAFGVLGVLVAAPLVAIVEIFHDELFRKRYLPTVTDAGLDRLARKALNEKVSDT